MPTHNKAMDSVNTVMSIAPYLGGVVGGYVFFTTPSARQQGLIGRALGGALTGAIAGGVWENTYNRTDSYDTKVQVVMGTSVIGAGAAAVAGFL